MKNLLWVLFLAGSLVLIVVHLLLEVKQNFGDFEDHNNDQIVHAGALRKLVELANLNKEYESQLEKLKAENEDLRQAQQAQTQPRSDGDGQADPLVEKYLETVSMGLLGGLTHTAHTDPSRGGTTDYIKRNECLTRHWETGGIVDICILKWDAYERMKRVKAAYADIRKDGVVGDMIECGVWRGGITIWMKALLTAYGDTARRIWVSDSFSGVPNAARQKEHPAFKGIPSQIADMDVRQWGGHVMEPNLDKIQSGKGKVTKKNILTVEGEIVEDNFKRFGLLDDSVKFVQGYFNDTLPTIRDRGLRKISLLRVDGDLYSSTMDVLENLYPMVTSGGYVIFDDYPLPQSQRAIYDFFKRWGLDKKLLKTDRITEQKFPEGFPEDSSINHYAYFRKPYKNP
jgi:hypothetical protein